MRLDYNDKSFVEISLSKSPSKVNIILGAPDFDNPLKKIINSAEVDIKDFAALVYGLGVVLPKPVEKKSTEHVE